ncbi:MAG: DUF5407 family protein [Chlamydiia bacterium]|nr:DUF5407 family protein [Chlamydiia bacterium]
MAQQRESFSMDALIEIVEKTTVSAKRKLEAIRDRKSAISIADMFDMQMLMNHLSQMSEMSTAVVHASNSLIVKMASAISR